MNEAAEAEIALSPEYSDFEADMLAMLGGDQSGLAIKYLYPAFDKVLHDSHYYIMGDEERLIQASAGTLADIVGQNRTVLELGCGSPLAVQHKTVHLLKRFNPAAYIANDFWASNAEASMKLVRREMPDLSASSLRQDFMKAHNHWPDMERPIILMFGSTISNLVANLGDELPEDVLTGVFERIKKIGRNGADLIVTYDTSNDGQDLEQTYNTPEHQNFRLGILSLINKYAISGHTGDGFSSPSVWCSRKKLLSHQLISHGDRTVTFYSGIAKFQTDSSYMLGKSYKYPRDLFTQVANDRSITTQAVCTQQGSPIVLQALSIDPSPCAH